MGLSRVITFFIFLILGELKLRFLIDFQFPGAFYPSPLNLSNHGDDWILRPEDITAVGLRQMYIAGRDFRSRFIDNISLLSPQYNGFEIYSRSFYYNSSYAVRAAYAKLAGIYIAGSGPSIDLSLVPNARPPISNWNNYTKYEAELRDAAVYKYYQPIPVHVSSYGPDYMLDAYTECPMIDFMIKNATANNGKLIVTIENLEKEMNSLYKQLGKCFDCSANVWNIFKADYHYRYLQSQLYEGVLPSDCKDIDFTKYGKLHNFVLHNVTHAHPNGTILLNNELYKFLVTNLNGIPVVDNDQFMPYEKKLKYIFLTMNEQLMNSIYFDFFNNSPNDSIRYASLLQAQISKRTDKLNGNQLSDYNVSFIYNGNPINYKNTSIPSIGLDQWVHDIQKNLINDVNNTCMNVPSPLDYHHYLIVSYYFYFILLAIMIGSWLGVTLQKIKISVEPTEDTIGTLPSL